MANNLPNIFGFSPLKGGSATQEEPEGERTECLVCALDLREDDTYLGYKICPRCRFHYSMSAGERIESLVDSNSFREINRSLISLDPLSFASAKPYNSRIFQDQQRTGLTEAALTGTASIAGTRVMLIVLDFGFMGGTMGCAVGEKIALTFERATKMGLPTVAIITSGGTRIQEGALSLMQMAKTTVAANRLNQAGIPLITVLANPATGQAYGSFANLADIILAEPGAIVGFSSLRVIERASDLPLPLESHTAESHLRHGMLDAVVQRTELRAVLGVLLDLLETRYKLSNFDEGIGYVTGIPRPQAWESVQLSRHQSRPTAADYMSRIFGQFVELHGDRSYGDDPTVISGLGQIAGQTVAVIGQQRVSLSTGDAGSESRTAPEGFRKAQRAMNLAAKFSLPLVTFVDTTGPDLSEAAEERGLGNTVANTMALMSGLESPTISVVIGQAGSGGALAFGVADRVLMLEHAIYTSVSPEEAAEVIFQDASRAEEAATSMRLTARDCLDLGIIDQVVAEPPNGAHSDPDEAARLLHRAMVSELSALQSMTQKKLERDRYKKYRSMGEYSSRIRVKIAKEVNSLQNLVRAGWERLPRKRRSQPAPEYTIEQIMKNGSLYGVDD
ncbi:MAG: acetyl-CoA carboxylase carboxyl transferase subunit beta [Dehalococcoidia bacterium]|nr:acetyl-CoA carboxylase carboxyl transferase subunit beta [Dehalococcoidia bacterium]